MNSKKKDAANRRQRAWLREKMADPQWRAEHNAKRRRRDEKSREQRRERERLYRKANPEKVHAADRNRRLRLDKDAVRKWQLKHRYGLTPDGYRALLERQDNKCAICSAGEPGGRGDWHIDHCHDTGQVRGALCVNCNVGLGAFKDDAALLQKARVYLGVAR